MNIDPNLIKIKDHHIKEIRRGNFTYVLRDAYSYLTTILTVFKSKEIKDEITAYKQYLQQFKGQLSARRKR